MELCKIILKGYIIHILQSQYSLNIYVKNEKNKGKNGITFKPVQIILKGNCNKYFSKLENLIQLIENRNIIVIIEEVFYANKTYLKHLNLKLSKKESNEVKEIISKKYMY